MRDPIYAARSSLRPVSSVRIGVKRGKDALNLRSTTVTRSKEQFDPQVRVRRKRIKSTRAPGGIRGSQRVQDRFSA